MGEGLVESVRRKRKEKKEVINDDCRENGQGGL